MIESCTFKHVTACSTISQNDSRWQHQALKTDITPYCHTEKMVRLYNQSMEINYNKNSFVDFMFAIIGFVKILVVFHWFVLFCMEVVNILFICEIFEKMTQEVH